MKYLLALLVVTAATGCVVEDDPTLSEDSAPLIAANKLAANKLAANKLAANKLAANKLAASSLETKALMDTADGRDVMSFIVGCALPSGRSLTLSTTAGVAYSFPGWLDLAPGWATRVPTVTERRWVTACLLARTNLYGVSVDISMRSDTNAVLATTVAETTGYTAPEGAFFGDIFQPTQLMYACANRAWTRAQTNAYRACALSEDGVTTECGFTYTGLCNQSAVCSDKSSPFGNCVGGGVGYAEVITIVLPPAQTQTQTQTQRS